MHLCYIFFVSIYFQNLPNILELQPDSQLVSRELEVQYVLSWPAGYILELGYSSANILYNDYAEEYPR